MYSMVEIIKKVLFKKALNSSLGKSKKIKLSQQQKKKLKVINFYPQVLIIKKLQILKGLCLYKNQYQ